MIDSNILEALIAPTTADEFFTEYWNTKPFVAHGDLERLPVALAALSKNMHEIAKIYNGHRAMTNGIKSPIMISTTINVETMFNMGMAVFMSDISPYSKDLVSVLRNIESNCGCKPGSARIGAFMAPEGSGLRVHYDADDIFSVQLRGTKRFNVSKLPAINNAAIRQYAPGKNTFEELYPQTLDGFPATDDSDHVTIDMQPGTVLYMPKGTWHSTEASDEESISISIGFDNPTAADTILRALRYLLLQDPEWRQPLYGLWGDPRQNKALDRATILLKNLGSQIEHYKADNIVLAESLEIERLRHMHDDSIFVKEPNSLVRVQNNAGEYQSIYNVRFISVDSQHGEKELLMLSNLPEGAADVFEWLGEQRKPFTLGEFKEEFTANDAAIKEMFEAAIKGGLIRMLWFPKNDLAVQD